MLLNKFVFLIHGCLIKKLYQKFGINLTFLLMFRMECAMFIFMSLWAVVNLNLNKTCPVCTGLPDNSMYGPDPMVARFLTIFCTVRRPNQTNIRQGSIFLA